MKRDSEIVVIGCGIIGTAIAYYLTSVGREVLILDKSIPAAGSSGACDGTIFIQSKQPGPKLEMGLKSAKLYSDLSRISKYRFGYKQQGGMILIETDEEYDILAEIVEKQQAGGANVSLISGEEAKSRQPGLSDCVKAATWCPDDAHINPMYATLAFLNMAMDNGAKLMKDVSVIGISQKGGTVAKVVTSQGEITTKCIVNAAGVNAMEISSMVGLDTPVLPRKGEVVITEQIEPFLTGIYLDARYIAIKHNPKIAEKSKDPSLRKGVGMVIEQTHEGNLLIGSSREFVGFNRNTSYDVLSAISNRAVHFFPALQRVSMIRSFAGLRPFTPDGLPYIGGTKAVKGFVVAAGHEGDGIALAPETGRRVMEYIVNGVEEGLGEYSPDRVAK